ncbi:MAG: hypothetical protein ABUL71_03520 [Gemmatimonadota bacterium]
MNPTGPAEEFDEVERVGSLPLEIAPPPALRASTLRAVARQRTATRWRRVAGTIAAVAAMVMIAISLQPRRKSASDFPGAGRELLAREHAEKAFAQLDDAERDLTAALQRQPADRQLEDALARVRRQRDALRQLVTQVNQ